MSVYDFIIRLIIVIAAGLAIGFERQLTGHNVRFKTTVLIAIGSFVFIATEVFIGSDATRMAANVITGIGFLCSGVIFKNGSSVNGLTTAATLWCTSAIAVVIGYGYIVEGVIASALLIVINVFTSYIDRNVNPIEAFKNSGEKVYLINVECLKSDTKKIKKIILEDMPKRSELIGVEIEKISGTKCKLMAKIKGENDPTKELTDICEKILDRDVISVYFEMIEE